VGGAFFPLDRRLKIEPYRQTTRRLERQVCEVGVRLPHRQAAAVVRELRGVPMTGKQVSRITHRHGQRAVVCRDGEIEAAWEAPLPVGRQPQGPEVLYIEADGSWVNSRESLKMEGKVGLVHQGPQQVGHNRMKLRSAVYVTTFEGSERLGEELYLEADRQGLEQAGLVVFLSDGAAGLREIHQTHFHDALYVLDWFHLRRELHRALRGAAAELGDDYIAAVRMTLKDLLWFGEVDLALERLSRLRGRLAGAQARDAITNLKRYIRNNRYGIGYAHLYEQGIHVASGPIEKAGDLVINRRCELRGMAWYRDSANAICNLRSFRLNGRKRWKQFWKV
jgi:hypothetical protein